MTIFQAQPNGTITDPGGDSFVVRGVSMFDYLFVSYEPRSDYRFRQVLSPLPPPGISGPTYGGRTIYISEENVKFQLDAARTLGVNLIRLSVEPAMEFASISYLDPSNGLTYPSDFDMLDVIINYASSIGIVVQLQNGNDLCPVAFSLDFMRTLISRYWQNPYVWICPANELNGAVNGGVNVYNTAFWQSTMGSYMTVLRGPLASGSGRFRNPVVIGPTAWSHDLNAVDAILQTDGRFRNDQNMIIGIHQYQVNKNTTSFRNTDLASTTTEWFQYVGKGKYCIIIDEVGINNWGLPYDPNLNPSMSSPDLTVWNNMQLWAIDFLDWVSNSCQSAGLAGCNGLNWNSWIDGMGIYDYNSMHQAGFALSTWGDIYRKNYLQHELNTSWTKFLPVVSAHTGTLGTISAVGQYMIVGHLVHVQTNITIQSNGSGAGFIKVKLPIGTSNGLTTTFSGMNYANCQGISGIAPWGSDTISIFTYAGTYPGGSGSVLCLNGFYAL